MSQIIESELIHGLKDLSKMLDYMNWRLQGACLRAIRMGIIRKKAELIQLIIL